MSWCSSVILFCLWEVPGPNLGWDTGYPEGFYAFPILLGKCWDGTLKQATS